MPNINPDLIRERNNCTFNIEEFAEWWNGGREHLSNKRHEEKTFLNDPELQDEIPISYLSHKELYEYSIKKLIKILEKFKQANHEGNDLQKYFSLLGGAHMLGSGLLKEGNPMTVHFVMFIPTIISQATIEQQAEWLPRINKFQIIGTYAQTELGHGTFIRGLETRADYDIKTQEFVLNSPTLTSYKWWPGGLAHSANYAIILAQLYIKNECFGIQPFMVQIRNEDTFLPMAGVHIGDIGTKLGMKAHNNGFLGLKNVRIPRTNMLMRNAKVLEDGTFVKPQTSVLTYSTMMFVRVVIVRIMANNLATASTIATRYSAVRRQSPIDPNKPEPQIIDHVTQQLKLFPQIAKCVIFRLTASNIWDMYSQVTSELKRGNLERLPELHAMSCCLKAVCSSDASTAVEQLRLACGGHGYMESSNFPLIYGKTTAAITYEGENTVMLLQTARYLIKAWSKALKGEDLVPTVAYLREAIEYETFVNWDGSIPQMIRALEFVAAKKIKIAYDHMEERRRKGMSQENAANMTAIELIQAADMHCRAFLVKSGYEQIENNARNVSVALAEVLRQILELFVIDTCFSRLADLLRFGNLKEKDVCNLQTRLEDTLTKLRPNAVGIVDGFDIPDAILSSTLGAYDGNVYERLFEEAQKSPLNQESVNKSFHLYLKPFMKSNL